MHQIASFKTTFSKKLQLPRGPHPLLTPALRKCNGRRYHASFERRWHAILDFRNLPPGHFENCSAAHANQGTQITLFIFKISVSFKVDSWQNQTSFHTIFETNLLKFGPRAMYDLMNKHSLYYYLCGTNMSKQLQIRK